MSIQKHRKRRGNKSASKTLDVSKPPRISLALMNLKGGTGKTTLAVALAEMLTLMFRSRTLIIDCDFQGSASITLLGRKRANLYSDTHRTLDYAILDALENDKPPNLLDYIVRDPFTIAEAKDKLAFLPASPDMPRIERRIVAHFLKNCNLEQAYAQGADHIATAIRSLESEFDCIIFDCPPGITLFSEAAVKACEHLLVPTLPNEISIAAVAHLRSEIERIRPNKSFDELHLGTVISKMRHRNARAHSSAQMQSIDRLLDSMDGKFRIMRPYLPFCIELETATWRDASTDGWPFAKRYGAATRALERLSFAIAGAVNEIHGKLEAAE